MNFFTGGALLLLLGLGIRTVFLNIDEPVTLAAMQVVQFMVLCGMLMVGYGLLRWVRGK